MIISIYILGFIISFAFDVYWYYRVKDGSVSIREINYPRHYVKLKPSKLFVEFILWAIFWPVVLGGGICSALYFFFTEKNK